MLFIILNSLPKKFRSKVEELYYEYRNDMLYTALGIVNDFSQAEDIVQLAFMRIMKHIVRISDIPGSEVKGYIIYIVKNLSIDFLRKQKHDNTIPYENLDLPAENEESLENIAIFNMELDMVKKKIKEMDDRYALPLILKYTLGLLHYEIADLLDISVEDARVRCHRGRLKLIEAIRKEAIHGQKI